MKPIILLYFFVMSFQISWACEVTPTSMITPTEMLVQRTANIALAEVTDIKLDGSNAMYYFNVSRMLKGIKKDVIKIHGYQPRESGIGNFNHHTDERFWQYASFGRLFHDIDCILRPHFNIGETYLLFLDKPYHIKGFEQVDQVSGENKDNWLRYVEKKIHSQANSQLTRKTQ